MQEEHEQITINDNYEQGANLETLKEDSNDDCQSSEQEIPKEEEKSSE
jgi:hypothetical protein